MRTTEKDVQAAIVKVLSESGFNVCASEQEEGFDKPVTFVDVFPSSTKLLSALLEEVTADVEIKYIPSTETVEHLRDTAIDIKNLFLYKPLCVNDRRLTIQQMDFEREKNVLFAFFDISFMQETPNEEEYEPMEALELGGSL